MSIFIAIILSAIISYLIGSCSFAIIFSFLWKQQDIREYGSKNAGMTNVVRIYGFLPGIFVFLGDFLKAVGAVYLCNFLFLDINQFCSYGKLVAGLSVIIGHLYPIYFKFRGGKGISTSAGFILTQNIKLFIFVVVVFFTVLMIARVVAIASISAAVGYPVSTLIFFQNYLVFVFSLIISVLVIYSHRSNIKKLFINKNIAK